ncbi:unnamed protein product [Phytophthora lilii]|uniref:Unnamed protein product n=1 Tax=Phytophthora lilii TaxID=2077276 RepID=A0A9W6X1C4_9STRA|nr:unnamed protein product [Phytophthora lilii]
MKQATNEERRALWETLLLRIKNGKLKRGDKEEAAFGLGRYAHQKRFPAIRSKWVWKKDKILGVHIQVPIVVQQDNAKPHVMVNDPEVLAAGQSDGWNITMLAQPAQSPDLNTLDCGVFNAIQSLQSFTVPRKPEYLIKEVERAF